jgi:hypothetical protein
MLRINIRGERLVLPMTQGELTDRVAKVAGLVKTMTGIGNNAAWSATLEALDNLRLHSNFRHLVKREFNFAIVEFKAYEHRLVYAEANRLFSVSDLTPEYRKRYGNISDREYYDYWAATGTTAYYQKRQWMTNLWNKFRLSLIGHNVPDPDTVAWGMAADACMKLAVCIYENAIKVGVDDFGVPRPMLEVIFGSLNISPVEKRWDRALMMLEPFTATYELNEQEQRNIQLGLDQLQEEWTSCATLREALSETTEAYEDVFRTKGEMKKALRYIETIREE